MYCSKSLFVYLLAQGTELQNPLLLSFLFLPVRVPCSQSKGLLRALRSEDYLKDLGRFEPGLLGGKRERYLSAMQLPLPYSFSIQSSWVK